MAATTVKTRASIIPVLQSAVSISRTLRCTLLTFICSMACAANTNAQGLVGAPVDPFCGGHMSDTAGVVDTDAELDLKIKLILAGLLAVGCTRIPFRSALDRSPNTANPSKQAPAAVRGKCLQRSLEQNRPKGSRLSLQSFHLNREARLQKPAANHCSQQCKQGKVS